MESVSTPVRARVSLMAMMVFILLVAGCGGGEVPQKNCGGAPCLPPGEAPTLSVAAGDTENVLTLTPPAGVTAPTFDIYWSTSPNVTTATGTRITAQTSPFHHAGLTNGIPIFYVATITGGTSASTVAGGMPGKWTQLLQGAASVPPARDSHTAVYDSTSDRMIVFGGRAINQPPLNDLWILQGASTTSPAWNGPVPPNAPQGRLGHTAVYSLRNKQMTIFGGAFNTSGTLLTNELWGLTNADGTSGSVWSPRSGGAGPAERWGHAAVYDSTNDRMIVFGGSTQTNGALGNDVWVLEQATTAPFWRSITVTGGPSARCCMATAWDPTGHRMIVFGGFGGFDQTGPIVLGDLWTLTFNDASPSTATWQQLNPLGGTPPSARCCGVMLWDNGKLLLFGGGEFGSPSSDDKIHALVLNPATFATADGPGGGPAPRVFPPAVPVARFLLFGGSTASALLNDLWRLD